MTQENMKKKIVGFTLAVASVFVFSVSALNLNNGSGMPDVSAHQAAPPRQMTHDRYEGMTLTDTQKKQLPQLDAKSRAEMKQRKKAFRRADREAEANGREISTEEKEARRAEIIAFKRQYLAQVKAIVGPEQYVIFLENEFVQPPVVRAR